MTLQELINNSANIITVIWLPYAIFAYLRENKNRRLERRKESYAKLDERYIEMQKLCLKYPKFDVFDTPKKNPKKLNKDQEKQEEALLLIRIAIFEMAFLELNSMSDEERESQMGGWYREIFEWIERDNFKKVWIEHSEYYDSTFAEYFNNQFRAAGKIK